MAEALPAFLELAIVGAFGSPFVLASIAIGLQPSGCRQGCFAIAYTIGLLLLSFWGLLLGALLFLIPVWIEFAFVVLVLTIVRERGWKVHLVSAMSNTMQLELPEVFNASVRTFASVGTVAIVFGVIAQCFRGPLAVPATREEVLTAVLAWSLLNRLLLGLNSIAKLVTILGKRSLWWSMCVPIVLGLAAACCAAWPYAGAFTPFFGGFAGFQLGTLLIVSVVFFVMRRAGFQMMRIKRPIYRPFALTWPATDKKSDTIDF